MLHPLDDFGQLNEQYPAEKTSMAGHQHMVCFECWRLDLASTLTERLLYVAIPDGLLTQYAAGDE